ncbi:MAG TPA: type I methionyl aminopeptidase [Segeticoccus sp.]|uniref:type I methionyl aminopeptidase n=1 Tax=Segeticoccus sp. TaxID=2706531 RepID=UPI002D802E65|nr:type I methionyl aminopeptidase [Segeticoccus sp.]HET8599246.1 type I methionyl aminopeptidase [Segeticoccus sp.]
MFGRSRLDTKTPDQLLRMRRAGLVVGQTLQLMAQTVRPGMTTRQLDELAEEHIRGCGATPSFLGYHGFTGSLCTSVNEEVVHGIPGGRVLEQGDLISIDCGAIVDGWHGDAALSLVVGGRDAARPEDLELIDATEDSMWAGIAALAVGESLYAVGAAVEDSLVEAGERSGREYGIVEDYVGHGIGTEMHQDPQVPNYRVRDRGPTVRVGTTVAIEPMVTLGSAETHLLEDEWTVITADGSRAAHWENTVAVTEHGLWVLTALDGGEERLSALGASYGPLS